nr:MAG TPA_asm: hypothetical protein [Caudoviricetes sp.]
MAASEADDSGACTSAWCYRGGARVSWKPWV